MYCLPTISTVLFALSFSKGFALYQSKRGSNAWFYKSRASASVLQTAQCNRHFRRVSNQAHRKSGSISSVCKETDGSRQIFCKCFCLLFPSLQAQLWSYSLRALSPSFSVNASMALAFCACVMAFHSAQIRCTHQPYSAAQRLNTHTTRRCTRPLTASFPSLVPRCGLCAFSGG